MKRKLTALLLALTLLLTACGRSGAGTAGEPELREPGDAGETGSGVTIAEARIPSETEPGYKSTVIEPPQWAGELGSGAVLGDVFYILAETGEGAQAAAAYDTIREQWQRYDLDMSPVYCARVQKFSAAGGALWVLLREGFATEGLMSLWAFPMPGAAAAILWSWPGPASTGAWAIMNRGWS